MSVALVYVVVVVSDEEFCTLTVRVEASEFFSGRMYLWSISVETTVYLVVIYVH